MLFGPVIYTKNLYDRLYYNHTQSFDYYISYPQFLSVGHFLDIQCISRTVRDISCAYIQEQKESLFEKGVPVSITQSYTIPYMTYPYLSILFLRREKYSHTTLYDEKAYNFFLSSGKEITLADMLGTEEYAGYIKEQLAIQTEEPANPDAAAAEELMKIFDPRDFFLTPRGLTVFFPGLHRLPEDPAAGKYQISL